MPSCVEMQLGEAIQKALACENNSNKIMKQQI